MIRRVRMVIGGCLCAVAVILEGLELSNVTRETLPTWVLHSGHEITIPILIAGLVLIWLGKSEAKEENNANPQLQPVTNTNTNTASPTQNVEQHFHLAPPEIPKPPKATEPAKPRHNVQLGVSSGYV